MGRRNKKIERNRQKANAKMFLKHREPLPDYSNKSEQEKRLEVAANAVQVLGSPEMSVSRIGGLLVLANDQSQYIRALAMNSLSLVFVDVVPGYQIKLHNQSAVLSTEVKALRVFQGLLLGYYEQYLNLLKENSNSKGSIKCATRMLERLHHFNYREQLLEICVKKLSDYPQLVLPALKAILVSQDLQFRHKTVKRVHQYVKITSYKIVPHNLFQIFLDIDFSVMTPKPKKKKKIDKETEHSLKEIDTEAEHNTLARAVSFKQNQNTLREVLAMFFRVLKFSPNSPHVRSVLRGVAKYTPILNIQIVMDLLKHLLQLLNSNKLSSQNQLHCLRAAISILSKSGEGFQVQERSFAQMLYNALLSFPVDFSTQIAYVKALQWLLLERRQYSFQTISAFVKRMLQIAFHCALDLNKALVCMCQHVAVRYPRCKYLLEEPEGADAYRGDLEDPVLANASTSNIHFELAALESIQDKELKLMIKAFKQGKSTLEKKPLEYLKMNKSK